VRYPERLVSFDVPDDQLVNVILLLRQNLEYAVDLHLELDPSFLPLLAPIEPDPNLVGTSAERDFGINPSPHSARHGQRTESAWHFDQRCQFEGRSGWPKPGRDRL
jgi:hypothetical protein